MRCNLESLVGETLSYIDTDDSDEIMLTTTSGRKIHIYHQQDCCESVGIVDTVGNWHNLIGKVVIEASKDFDECNGECCDSCTHTRLTFKVNDATVISKWIGESNGYYSEGVDIEELTNGN